jgi:predicted DNA-binding transcriptional regulator AlpA
MALVADELTAETPRRSEYAHLPPKARRVKDACSTLGISRATLYKLSLQGKVKLVKIAARTVVAETEIDRLASKGAA